MRVTPLGKYLQPATAPVSIDPGTTYRSIGVLNRGRGTFDNLRFMGADTKYRTMYEVAAGQLIYSKLKAFEGAIAIVSQTDDGALVSGEFPVFNIVSNELDESYLRHLIQSDMFSEAMAQYSTGMGARRERLRPDALLSITVPLPKMDEQRAIAAYLDRLGDAAQDVLQDTHVQAIVAGLRESLVIDNQEHPLRPLGDLLTPARAWEVPVPGGEYRPIGVRGFGRGLIRYPPTGSEGLGKLRYYRVPGRALIVSNIKAWEGAVAVSRDSDSDLIASNRFLCYQPKSVEINLDYVQRILLSASGIAALGRASPGSADRNRTLSIASFEAIRIPVPPRSAQDRIAATSAQLDRLDARHAQRSRIARALPQAARNEVFSKLT